jgi:hypothetical protein
MPGYPAAAGSFNYHVWSWSSAEFTGRSSAAAGEPEGGPVNLTRNRVVQTSDCMISVGPHKVLRSGGNCAFIAGPLHRMVV